LFGAGRLLDRRKAAMVGVGAAVVNAAKLAFDLNRPA
jgi:hypothetical protein